VTVRTSEWKEGAGDKQAAATAGASGIHTGSRQEFLENASETQAA